MPLIQCSECGNNYPDRLVACPKCGAVIPNEKKIDTQLKMLRIYITVGLLLIFTGIFGMTHFPVPPEAEMFLFSLLAALAGTLLIIYVFVLFLFLKGYKKASYLISLSAVGITAFALFWLFSNSSRYEPAYEGTLEDAIPYAEIIISSLDNYKSVTGDYPYDLEYLDVDFNKILKEANLMLQPYNEEPATFSMWYRWLGYYLITTEDFVLCIEERKRDPAYYSSMMYSSRDRQWKNSACSDYHGINKLRTSGIKRNAIVKNKEAINKKVTRYRVEFQDGEILEIMDKWPYFSVGECVKIFFSENSPPRIALGDDCWN